MYLYCSLFFTYFYILYNLSFLTFNSLFNYLFFNSYPVNCYKYVLFAYYIYFTFTS